MAVTESEWLSCDDPGPMLAFLRATGGVSRRKLRLFACACCRHVWEELPEAADRAAVVAAERYADGLASGRELAAARQAASEAGWWAPLESWSACKPSAWEAAEMAALTSARRDWSGHALLRDIFAPFRRRPARRRIIAAPDATVAAMARAAYDERCLPGGELDPVRLAVLADALEEAGCADDALLSHLRSPGPHVRGCWPLDLALALKLSRAPARRKRPARE
jgi:hypothetical protein